MSLDARAVAIGVDASLLWLRMRLAATELSKMESGSEAPDVVGRSVGGDTDEGEEEEDGNMPSAASAAAITSP